MAKRVLRIYFSLAFLFELAHSVFYATYVLFLLNKGMDLLQVNIINFCFMITVFLMEVPTGAFADTLGRKFSFVNSCFILSLSFFIYFFSKSFWQFVVAEIIGAIGSTFHSGAFQSWLVDSLKHYDFKGSMQKVFSKEEQIVGVGKIIGCLIGAYVARKNLAIPWLIGGIGMLAVGIIAQVKMREDYFEKTVFSFRKILSGIKITTIDSVKYGLKSRVVVAIVCFTAIQGFSVMPMNMYWQPRFEKFVPNTFVTGCLFVVMSLAMIGGNKLAVWLSGVLKNERLGITSSQIVIGIGMIVASLSSNFAVILMFFLVHEVGRGMVLPIKSKYLHDHIPSKQRATIISCDSMFFTIGGSAGLLISGILAKNISIPFSWLVFGVALTFGTLVLYFTKKE